jgi:alkyldihydroxyacetonephosphate synthase
VPTRRFWGWGHEGEGPTAEQTNGIVATLAARFGQALSPPITPPTLAEISLPAPRLTPPDALAGICTTDPAERAGHTYGKSYRDIVRGLRRDFTRPPDVVAVPGSEDDVARVLDWCASVGAAAIPYGGGSSVVGGVEAGGRGTEGYAGVVTIDLRRLDRVIDIDRVSRAARIQAGVYGPALEDQLRPHGLTLRHFPQSFEFSTLGGWLATRSGGHYATLATHIDDFVESIRAVTPSGVWESRRLPGSGAGPSPDRMLLGSEGVLGVITEAWMRLQDRPQWKAAAAVRFADFFDGVEAARALAQSGLYPSNCRLLDATEALVTGTEDGSRTVLLVAFESADHPVDAWMARALELCRDHKGEVPDDVRVTTPSDENSRARTDGGTVDAWRGAFIRAPYLRDALASASVISETFETACPWSGFAELHASATAAVEQALRDICGGGWITCRFTHCYPDGPAPYFTILAPGRRGGELEQWDEIKAAASEALMAAGGTITHHHAVGRDHRPWYDQQRPDPFAAGLRALKRAVDPASVLNPGVLLDP